jgi:superfamily II DNA/RNA helicase
MLVATDAKQLIDVDNITHVVNYQLLTKLKRTITVLVVLDVQEN